MATYLESGEVSRQLEQGAWVSRCLNHPGRRCPVAWSRGLLAESAQGGQPAKQPILMNFSGPVCLPWTPFGSRQGRAHMSREPWLLWCLEMQRLRYDLVFMENSSLMPMGEVSRAMQKHAEVVGVVFSPHELGWPVRRGRLMVAALDRASLVWLGPDPANAGELKRHFMSFFARHTVVEASCFACADSPAKVDVERARRGGACGLDARRLGSSLCNRLLQDTEAEGLHPRLHAHGEEAGRPPFGHLGLRCIPESSTAAAMLPMAAIPHLHKQLGPSPEERRPP